jgi:hypothetical protein
MNYVSAHLVPLISLSLLLCATAFLGVLIGRLRFNDGYRDAESLLKVADAINQKEEHALQAEDWVKASTYLAFIDTLIKRAENLETGLSMTVTHMRLCRNAGIGFFVGTLILCGFFFDDIVAALIAFLFLLTLIIGYFDRFTRRFMRRQVYGRGLVGSLMRPGRR